MKYLISFFIIFQVIVAITPPIAPKFPEELTIHDDTRIDNYYWLNHRDDDLVIKYLIEENQYRDSAMAHTSLLRQTLYKEMTQRLTDSESSVPYHNNGYLYREIYPKDADYPLYQRKPNDNVNIPWTTILNVNDLSKEAEYIEVAWINPSPNNHFISFSMDTTGNYEYEIRFLNIITGKLLNDRIQKTWGSSIWSKDNKSVYYNVKDPITNRVEEVKKHRIGFDNSTDKSIYFEKDTTFSAYINQSLSDKYLFIACESTTSSEYRVLDLSNRKSKLKIFYKREKNHLYYPYHHNNYFYILTNNNKENFRLMRTHVDSTNKSYWSDVIPYNTAINPVEILPLKNFIVLRERKNGLPNYSIYDIEKDTTFSLKFDEVSYHTIFSKNHDFEADFFRFEYSSPITPNQIFDYNLKTNKKILKSQKEILGHYNPNNYSLQRKDVISKDGTIIPLTIVYNKYFFNANGQNPSLLYGYGAYGSSNDAYFINSIISLLDRGVIFGFAHVRGGGEFGQYWYRDGKMLRKKNTFIDFISCADYLVNNKYSKHEIMFAEGMSAGGLLMGAIANIAPEKFRGIIAEVPFVDVITTMLNPDIPLTSLEYEEWGDPLIEEYYNYMKSYSPYDNVTAKDYPAMFITASYNDSQVQYWEPAKWAAKLRELKTDNNLLILSTDLSGSHGGASGRFSPYELIAMQHAFILDQIDYPYKKKSNY